MRTTDLLSRGGGGAGKRKKQVNISQHLSVFCLVQTQAIQPMITNSGEDGVPFYKDHI